MNSNRTLRLALNLAIVYLGVSSVLWFASGLSFLWTTISIGALAHYDVFVGVEALASTGECLVLMMVFVFLRKIFVERVAGPFSKELEIVLLNRLLFCLLVSIVLFVLALVAWNFKVHINADLDAIKTDLGGRNGTETLSSIVSFYSDWRDSALYFAKVLTPVPSIGLRLLAIVFLFVRKKTLAARAMEQS